jgi:hypothetical protein
MHVYHIVVALCTTAVLGWEAPQCRDFNRVWHDDFRGDEGVLPNASNWNIIDVDIGVNNELQIYKRDPRNVQLSGRDTLQLVPWKDRSAPRGWTSGRVESI